MELTQLRYAVVHRGAVFRAWQTACVDRLERSGLAKLCCIVGYEPTTPNGAFERLCEKLQLPSQKPAALDLKGKILLDARSPECERSLRALGIDFLLCFDDTLPAADLANVATYGAWCFTYGDPERFSSSVPAFWEIYYNHGATCATLRRLDAGGTTGIALKTGYFRTVRESFSWNIELLFSELRTWPVQVCRDITAGAAPYFSDAPIAPVRVRLGRPNALQIRILRALQLKNFIVRYLRIHVCAIDWNVFALKGTAADFIGRDARAEVSSIGLSTAGLHLADPCAVVRDGSTYVFCEEYGEKLYRGRIVALEGGRPDSPPRVAIEEPHHLSYPQVFEHAGEMFCIAESVAVRSLGLYRAVEYPYRWKYVHTILEDVRAVDPTILRSNDKWWLFYTSGNGPGDGDQSHLYIWYASDLFGTWSPHAANPVKIDVRSARPAGQFFEHNGALYRPAQDCSQTYGGAICINRIDKLTELEFRETVVGRIRPPAGAYRKGIHTITSSGDWCIVDAKRYTFNASGVVRMFKDALRALVYRTGFTGSARVLR